MRKISFQNPQVNKTYRTFISRDYDTGTDLYVMNTNSFSINDILVVGEPSEELTEKSYIDTVTTPNLFALSAQLKFSHGKGTSIYKAIWDQIVIESRVNSSASFSPLTTIDIQWDDRNNQTIYYDENGAQATQYRFRFYNSKTSQYSAYSPTLGGNGFARNQVGYMIEQVRKVVNDLERKIVSDDEIIRMFNRAQDIVYAHNPRYWFLLYDSYKRENGIPMVSDQSVYSFAKYPTFGNLSTIRFHYQLGAGNSIYRLKRLSEQEFDFQNSNLQRGKDDWIAEYKLVPPDEESLHGYFQVSPVPRGTATGTFYPNFYQIMPDLENVESATMIPIPSLLEDFAISEIEKIKGNDAKSKTYLDQFLGPKDQRGGFENITGLKLLDKQDNAQKKAVGQPQSLKVFRGQGAVSKLYGRPQYNRDFYKENYMD